jgi:hypothetical protein
MSSRARKRARAAAAGEITAAKAPAPAAPKPPSRSELKNEAARASLVPLREGERPTAVTVAAILTVVILVANAVLAFSGYEVRGKKPPVSGEIVFLVLMASMAWGLWRARYWAVLGLQALLALGMLAAGLSLPLASNVTSALIAAALFLACGTMFWFLVKAMARIQMPERR